MPKLTIDDKPHEVSKGQNALHHALTLGFDLPYFCWHPALGSIGACRQCAVKQYRDDNDQTGRIAMACMVSVERDTRISIDDPEAKAFRAAIIEWLMTNHPHDCPICDEGGECHLQDMTVMTGHSYRHYRFKKRTFRNQNLGPLVNHEMNRCITCYRCLRFYKDHAGGTDLHAFRSHNQVFFGRHEDGTLESEFSGNLVEVCPTGVFTDKTLKSHYVRKWDLEQTPSICAHCGLGCNILIGARAGSLRQVRNRYNGQVNGYFLCDRGRYAYQFLTQERQLREPLIRQNGHAVAVTPAQALEKMAAIVRRGQTIGIGSPRASLEANFALRRLVGKENFYAGLGKSEVSLLHKVVSILTTGPTRTPSLAEASACDAALILGEDLTNTAPMLALAIRQAARVEPQKTIATLHVPPWDDGATRDVVQGMTGPVFIASSLPTKLDDVAKATFRAAPADIAALAVAIANELDGQPSASCAERGEHELARSVAAALLAAKSPLIVSGTGAASEAMLEASANIAWALSRSGADARLSFVVPEVNSLGLVLLASHGLDAVLDRVRPTDTIVILENDLYRREDVVGIDSLLSRAGHVVVLDHLGHRVAARADVVLPAASYAESEGTVVSNEGRAQRYFRALPSDRRESWRWLADCMRYLGQPTGWSGADDVLTAMALEEPLLKQVIKAAPPAGFRVIGKKIPRQSRRASGRTALHANENVSETKPPDDNDEPLSFSMEGVVGQPPSSVIPLFWAPGWNSIQSLNKYQKEIGGELRGGDPGVRLIEPGDNNRAYFVVTTTTDPTESAQPGSYLMLPIFQIFGSEELSALSPPIAGLIPEPFIGIAREAALALVVADGDLVEWQAGTLSFTLPARLIDGLPLGVVAVPTGLPDMPWLPPLVRGQIRKVARP